MNLSGKRSFFASPKRAVMITRNGWMASFLIRDENFKLWMELWANCGDFFLLSVGCNGRTSRNNRKYRSFKPAGVFMAANSPGQDKIFVCRWSPNVSNTARKTKILRRALKMEPSVIMPFHVLIANGYVQHAGTEFWAIIIYITIITLFMMTVNVLIVLNLGTMVVYLLSII